LFGSSSRKSALSGGITGKAAQVSSSTRKILTVKNYTNTKFVNILLEKRIYMKLKKTAEELSTAPHIIIYNALILILKKGKAERN